MPLKRRTKLRFFTVVWFGLTMAVVGLIWEYIEIGIITVAGPLIGASVGITLGVVEESKLGRFTRSMPFTRAVFTKSALYLVVIAIPVLITGLIGGLLQGATIDEYIEWITSSDVPISVLIIYSIHLVISFARNLNRLLGPKTLVRYLRGTYHRPRIERRVFMFLDMKSSTSVAESLGGEKYFSLLNTFFRDISEPILEREAEIYQYVGDEVVLTWKEKVGFREANCVQVFFDFLAKVERRREHYEAKFGLVPDFKAGLHFGDVITAEVGDLKKEIVYSGDVLNTTARIESLCNEHGQQLLASEELVSQLQIPDTISTKLLGPIVLRGKANPVSIVGLQLNNQP